MPPRNCVATTKYFLVLNISSTGPHSGLSVQGIMTSDVHIAICASPIPMLLYMREATTAIATKGSPSAKYSVGTQSLGRMACSEASIVGCGIEWRGY